LAIFSWSFNLLRTVLLFSLATSSCCLLVIRSSCSRSRSPALSAAVNSLRSASVSNSSALAVVISLIAFNLSASAAASKAAVIRITSDNSSAVSRLFAKFAEPETFSEFIRLSLACLKSPPVITLMYLSIASSSLLISKPSPVNPSRVSLETLSCPACFVTSASLENSSAKAVTESLLSSMLFLISLLVTLYFSAALSASKKPTATAARAPTKRSMAVIGNAARKVCSAATIAPPTTTPVVIAAINP